MHNDGFHAFCTISRRFFTKNRWNNDEKTDVFFRIGVCCFQHCDPHETVYFIIRKLLFHFLRFCIFLKKRSKNVLQNRDHVFPLKITKMSSPGTISGPTMLLNQYRRDQKNPKNVKKSSFRTEQFFERFLEREKIQKKGWKPRWWGRGVPQGTLRVAEVFGPRGRVTPTSTIYTCNKSVFYHALTPRGRRICHWETDCGQNPKLIFWKFCYWQTGCGQNPKLVFWRFHHGQTDCGQKPKCLFLIFRHWQTDCGQNAKLIFEYFIIDRRIVAKIPNALSQ